MISYSGSGEAEAICSKDSAANLTVFHRFRTLYTLTLKTCFPNSAWRVKTRRAVEGNNAPTGTSARIHSLTCILILDRHSTREVDRPSMTIVCKACVYRHACGGCPRVALVSRPGREMSHGLGHPRRDSRGIPRPGSAHGGPGPGRIRPAFQRIESQSGLIEIRTQSQE